MKKKLRSGAAMGSMVHNSLYMNLAIRNGDDPRDEDWVPEVGLG
jgi:hypothetical protein